MNARMEKVKWAMLSMTRQCWEQGVASQALMECGEQELLEVAVRDMVLRQSSDGRLCNVENTPAVTDSAFCVPAVLFTGRRLGNEKYIGAAGRNIAYLLKDAGRAADGTLFHIIHTEEIWADSAAYLPYALALGGYRKEAFLQMDGICRRLYSEEKGLYNHMWDEKKGDYLRPLAWGVGNGWILTGHLRLLSLWGGELPEERGILEKRFYSLLDRMLECRSADYGFHDILDDPDTFQESETAAMVAYTIYRAVAEHLLSAGYCGEADRIREALLKKITANGLALDAASSPAFDRPGTSVECQAHVLMMEQAYENVRNS